MQAGSLRYDLIFPRGRGVEAGAARLQGPAGKITQGVESGLEPQQWGRGEGHAFARGGVFDAQAFGVPGSGVSSSNHAGEADDQEGGEYPA